MSSDFEEWSRVIREAPISCRHCGTKHPYDSEIYRHNVSEFEDETLALPFCDDVCAKAYLKSQISAHLVVANVLTGRLKMVD